MFKIVIRTKQNNIKQYQIEPTNQANTCAQIPNSKLKTQNSKLKTQRPGQALLVVALMMTALILFMGLGIDAGNLMGKSAKLQSAVDAAALSAAQMMSGGSGSITQTATTKAYQILEANGIPSNTLVLRQVDFPGPNQVHVRAVQRVNTYFMRLIPMWRTVPVNAQATADLNSYAEMTTKPYGLPGVVNELNMMVWGVQLLAQRRRRLLGVPHGRYQQPQPRIRQTALRLPVPYRCAAQLSKPPPAGRAIRPRHI